MMKPFLMRAVLASGLLHIAGGGIAFLTWEKKEQSLSPQSWSPISFQFKEEALPKASQKIKEAPKILEKFIKPREKNALPLSSRGKLIKSLRRPNEVRKTPSSDASLSLKKSGTRSEGKEGSPQFCEESKAPTYAPKPVYPYKARRKGWEGKTVVRLVVRSSGEVDKVALAKTSGYLCLDQEALEALQSWRFKAVSPRCQRRTFIVPVTFNLSDF